jgi:hypothetical protein
MKRFIELCKAHYLGLAAAFTGIFTATRDEGGLHGMPDRYKVLKSRIRIFVRYSLSSKGNPFIAQEGKKGSLGP